MDLFNTWLVKKFIAHRGIHNESAPENSIGAFQNAIDKNCPFELDVQLISDGTVVVFHDKKLQRLTGKDGYTKKLKKEDLKNYKLLGTNFSIPTLEEVLNLVNGKVPILIEIKNDGIVGSLENKILDILKNYKGEFAIQSFNPFVLQCFKNNAPEIIRGQLSSRFKNESLNFLKKFFLRRMYFNKKISEPHFVAYEAKALPNRFAKKNKNIPLLAWTVKGQEEYKKVALYCDNIIYEDFEPKFLKL